MADRKGRTFTCDDMLRNNFLYYQDMWKKKEFCDIKFHFGDETVSAHRLVITAVMPYFRDILASRDAEKEREGIDMPDIEPRAFKSLIEFAYSHEVKIDEENVKDLLAAACHLGVDAVREECCDFLGDTLDQENAMDFHELALNLNCSELLKITDCYFAEHFGEISQTRGFLNLPSTYLKELIRKDVLNIDSEVLVLEATLNWVKYSPDDRSTELPELLCAVRMPLIAPLELTQILESEEVLRKSTLCRDLVDEARNYNLLPQTRKGTCSFSTVKRETIKTTSVVRDNGSECIYKLRHQIKYTIQRFDLEEETWVTEGSQLFVGSGGFSAELHNNMYYFHRCYTLHYDPENKLYKHLNGIPTHRYHAGVSALKNKIYVCGGIVGLSFIKDVDALNVVECFEPEKNEWSKVRGMLTCRGHPCAVTLGEYIFVLGGRDGTSLHDTVERYNPGTDQWMEMASMLSKRSSAGAVPVNGKIYVCGGILFPNRIKCTATAEVYDPIKNTWNFISSMNTPRVGLSLLSCRGKIHAFGRYSDAGKRAHTFHIYDPENDEWTSGSSTDTVDERASAAVVMSVASF